MDKIGIFCSASNNIDPMYYNMAKEIGQWIGKSKKTLVYGGANLGLMECLAHTVKDNGGNVIGVIPSILEEKGKVSTYIDQLILTKNLSERKDKIIENAEILIVLPGGIGTLDETFHLMAQLCLGYTQKKIIFYNEGGFFNKLLELMKEMKEKNFIRQPLNTYYKVACTLKELTTLL